LHDPGVRNPRRNLLICLGVTGAALLLLALGLIEMSLDGWEDSISSGWKIGLAILPVIFAPLMAWNFWRGVKLFASIRRGEKVIGRWTVTAADVAEFAVLDDARNAHGGEYLNNWRRPRAVPPKGLEIAFVPDGVLAGDVYYTLVTTGIFKFTKVGMLPTEPPAIEFVTILTMTRGGTAFSISRSIAVLRLPAPREADAAAARVLDHFRKVAAGELLVHGHYFPRLVRIGLIGAPLCFAVAGLGYVLDGDGVPDLMLGLGILFGGAFAVLALVARTMAKAQRRER
jgi:hypothetical protein